MDFRPHGDHHLYCKRHGIIVAQPIGSWNIEAAQRYYADIRRCISQSPSAPMHWCRIVDLSQYQLHTPDVPKLLRRLAFWTARHGCVFHSYIFSNNLQKHTVKRMFEGVAAHYGEAKDSDDALEQCLRMLRRVTP